VITEKEITAPTVRPMTTNDIPHLVLEQDWLRSVYYDFIDEGRGPAWVLEDEEGLIACFGATILWAGVCEIWFSLIRHDRNLTVIRTSRKFLEEQAIRFGIHRYHATVTGEKGRKFAEFFGFNCETPSGMLNYNPDKSTAWLYSRVL